jgi:hypothetical protein
MKRIEREEEEGKQEKEESYMVFLRTPSVEWHKKFPDLLLSIEIYFYERPFQK